MFNLSHKKEKMCTTGDEQFRNIEREILREKDPDALVRMEEYERIIEKEDDEKKL